MSASISGDQQVWVVEGWSERFTLPAALPNEATGWGNSLEQVAAFQVDRAVLFGYLEAANRAAVDRVARLTPEQLEQPIPWGTPETPVDTRPAWRAFMSICGDSLQHTGQINSIRGSSPNEAGFVELGVRTASGDDDTATMCGEGSGRA